MAKNDSFFKLLFAIELALLPLVICASIVDFMPKVAISLFVVAIAICRIWMSTFKDTKDRSHIIINAVGDIAVFVTLFVLFICLDLLIVPLAIVALVLMVVAGLLEIGVHQGYKSEIISIIQLCHNVVQCSLLVALSFVMYSNIATIIFMSALALSSVLLIIFRVIYLFRYTDFVKNIKKRFSRK